MFDSPILDTAISLVFIYFLLSTLVTSVTELVNYLTRSRGKMLEFALQEVLNDRFNHNYAELLYTHPQLDLLKQKQSSLPDHLGAPQFTTGVMDLIGMQADRVTFVQDEASGIIREHVLRNPDALQRFKDGLTKMNYSDLKVLLQSFVDQSGGDTATLDGLRTRMENWYNAYMEEVGAWFRRKVRRFIILASVMVTVALNVDSIRLVRDLYRDDALREPLIAAAIAQVEKGTPGAPAGDAAEQMKHIKRQLKEIESFQLPLGWQVDKATGRIKAGNQFNSKRILATLLGYAFTVVALTMGAPFWFQAMQRLLALRRTPKTSEASAS